MASQAPTEAGCSALGMVDGKPEATLLDKLQAAGVVKPSVETRSTPPKLFNLCLQDDPDGADAGIRSIHLHSLAASGQSISPTRFKCLIGAQVSDGLQGLRM